MTIGNRKAAATAAHTAMRVRRCNMGGFIAHSYMYISSEDMFRLQRYPGRNIATFSVSLEQTS